MASPRDPDDLIARAGRGDPRQDQHFLVDDRILDRIPSYAAEFDTGHVLEIGGGTGALTDRLLAVADRVTVVERDENFVRFLRKEFADEVDEGRLRIRQGDALDIEFPDYTVCISNLPYGISTEIAFRLLPERKPAVLTFQAEVAERMAADPGTADYGRLSVTAQHYTSVEIVEPIPPEAFDPQPEVDSAVVRLTPLDPTYRVPDEAAFLQLVKALFTQRRKTVRNAIRNTTHISGIDDGDAVVAELDEELLSRRPDALDPESFAKIARVADQGR